MLSLRGRLERERGESLSDCVCACVFWCVFCVSSSPEAQKLHFSLSKRNVFVKKVSDLQMEA